MTDDDWEPACLGSSMDLDVLVSLIGTKLMGREVDFMTTVEYLQGLPEDDKCDVFDYIIAATERSELPTDEELEQVKNHLNKKIQR